jgi:hypothetical protein
MIFKRLPIIRGGALGMLDIAHGTQIEREEAITIVAAYRKGAPAVCKFWKRIDARYLPEGPK